MMRVLLFAALIASSSSALAGPIEARFSGSQPIAISGLSDEGTCIPATVSGRVVKRVFDDGELKLKGAIIEERSGERNYINIDTDKINKASAAEQSNASRGLQVLLKEGNRVRAKIFACGAAGRVMMLEAVERIR